MFIIKKYFFGAVVAVLLSSVCSQEKSSLTFVIDDTGSMGDDIRAVREGANAIFDTVMRSNASQIEDFVLVTFNDPDYRHRTTTRDRDELKKALEDIHVDGGGDCPEMCMAGITLGLEHSRPSSLIYVFTDASAKDPERYNTVRQLAQKKQSQVVFVLTGDCNGGGNEEVYYNLAQTTNGQVFHLDQKNEVGKILKYVENQINNRKTVIANTRFPPGTHKLNYAVDSKMKELVISVSGTDPKLTNTDPDGGTAPTEEIVRTRRVVIVKVTEVKPGTYTAEVSSPTETSVVVTAETTVHFQHGFSPYQPSSIHDTVTRPIPGDKSYLAIKLSTEGPGDIKLDTVQILDLENNVVIEQPLKVVNKENQFYMTEAFVTPDITFKIAIKGKDPLNGKEITRISLTPIEPQVIDTSVPNQAPVITVVGDYNVKYNKPVSLRCKISAHPTPEVVWERNDGAVFETELSLVELPLDYMSVLHIERVDGNSTYKCKANNDYGADSKEIRVITDTYFKVLKKPESADIDLNEEARFECKIEAQPPAVIKWYKNGKKVKEDKNVRISDDRSTLIFNEMQPENAGKYACLAKSVIAAEMFKFFIQVNKAEKPIIDKTVSTIRVKERSDIDIPCKIVRGNPKPKIHWFFKQALDDEENPIDESDNDGVMHIEDVTPVFSGLYRCEAHNGAGNDYHNVEVIVEYPPEISKKTPLNILAREGDKVRLPCSVDGEPTPIVTWYMNDTKIEMGSRYKKGYHSDSLSFTAAHNDSATYTCVAENEHGSDNRTIQVRVLVQPYIEPPKKSILDVNVGSHVALLCEADGFPQPKVEWIFHSLEAKRPPQYLKAHKPSNTLFLPHIQEGKQGYYTCIATNDGGSSNITYEVKIFSPPNIENVYPEKIFKAVVGDLTLHVPCKATGNPKPVITWIKDGVNKIAAGTEWYDIQDDGTLIIKNVDKMSTGMYLCQAVNSLGLDEETYEVSVELYPEAGSPSETVLIEVGKSKTIKCPAGHKRIDSVRWFKDGLQVGDGPQITLKDTKLSDAGTYTCRVSDFAKSRSGHIEVKIGFKPRFIGLEEENIDLEEGVSAVMICEAEGEPKPKVSWWHNGKVLPSKEMALVLYMTAEDIGQYFCLVENEFGKIVRGFNIVPRECLVKIDSHLQGNQPIITTNKLNWPKFSTSNGNVKILPNENIKLFCPSGFINFPKTEIHAMCERGSDFIVDGRNYQFSDLQCKGVVKPITKRTGELCLVSHRYAERIKVGYKAGGKFLDVYNVCFDTENKLPLYTMYTMPHGMANSEPKMVQWQKDDLAPLDFDSLYECEQQKNFISRSLGKWFHKEDKCCFAKRQLVNAKDVLPGVSQAATYSHLNLAPQWSTCNTQNWESIERKVKLLAISSGEDLFVWTGTARELQISGRHVQIFDAARKAQNVPLYFWKVIQSPSTRASVAIIQINIPDLTLSEAYRHVPCRDICNEISWLKSKHWNNVNRGYTFCCNTLEFEKAFNLNKVFHGISGKVLYDISSLPDHSMT